MSILCVCVCVRVCKIISWPRTGKNQQSRQTSDNVARLGEHWGRWAQQRQHICCSRNTWWIKEGWAKVPHLDLSATLNISISGVSSWILMRWKRNLVYSFSRLRRQNQYEDNLNNEDNLKNEEDLKNEDDLKNKDNLKRKMTSKMETTAKMKTIWKMKTTSKMKTT